MRLARVCSPQPAVSWPPSRPNRMMLSCCAPLGRSYSSSVAASSGGAHGHLDGQVARTWRRSAACSRLLFEPFPIWLPLTRWAAGCVSARSLQLGRDKQLHWSDFARPAQQQLPRRAQCRRRQHRCNVQSWSSSARLALAQPSCATSAARTHGLGYDGIRRGQP